MKIHDFEKVGWREIKELTAAASIGNSLELQ